MGVPETKTPVNIEFTGAVKSCETCLVTHIGQFSNQLLETFRKIYRLKPDIPVT